ncbi:MAG: UDP-glucose 4-epimerase GalE [Bdellovibrionota bacterium]
MSNSSKSTVLLTGGAGYIGSHTAKFLIDKNYQVIVIDNLSTGYKWAVPSEAKFYQLDLLDKTSLEKVFKDNTFESVIHFAAKTSVEESVRLPDIYLENNYHGSLNLIHFCEKYKIKNFVFSSTAAVYGNTNSEPISEDTKLAPISPYGESKVLTEKALLESNLKTIIFRYFNVAGAKTDGTLGQATENATHLIKIAAEVASGKRASMYVFGSDYLTPDGTCVRDYIHVEDIVSAHIAGLEYLLKNGKPRILNLGYGSGHSVREVINTMKKVSGHSIPTKEAPRRAGDCPSVVAEASAARQVLQWTPQYDNLEIICRTAYDWEVKTKNTKAKNV